MHTINKPCGATPNLLGRYIASHYGEACGAFFRFHSTLLLISAGMPRKGKWSTRTVPILITY